MFLIDRVDKQRMESRAATPMVSLIECNYNIRSVLFDNVKFRENTVGGAEFDLAVQLDLKPRSSPVLANTSKGLH
jgi:hypothetical protein